MYVALSVHGSRRLCADLPCAKFGAMGLRRTGAEFFFFFGTIGPPRHERLSVDDLKGISADFAAICGRVSEHPILVLPSVFPIDE